MRAFSDVPPIVFSGEDVDLEWRDSRLGCEESCLQVIIDDKKETSFGVDSLQEFPPFDAMYLDVNAPLDQKDNKISNMLNAFKSIFSAKYKDKYTNLKSFLVKVNFGVLEQVINTLLDLYEKKLVDIKYLILCVKHNSKDAAGSSLLDLAVLSNYFKDKHRKIKYFNLILLREAAVLSLERNIFDICAPSQQSSRKDVFLQINSFCYNFCPISMSIDPIPSQESLRGRSNVLLIADENIHKLAETSSIATINDFVKESSEATRRMINNYLLDHVTVEDLADIIVYDYLGYGKLYPIESCSSDSKSICSVM